MVVVGVAVGVGIAVVIAVAVGIAVVVGVGVAVGVGVGIAVVVVMLALATAIHPSAATRGWIVGLLNSDSPTEREHAARIIEALLGAPLPDACARWLRAKAEGADRVKARWAQCVLDALGDL